MMSEELAKIGQHWPFEGCFLMMDQVIHTSYSDTLSLASIGVPGMLDRNVGQS